MKSYRNTNEDINSIIKNSGIYYFYDGNDNLLYIGKSKRLKYRIDGHQDCYHHVRESVFYGKMIKSKGYASREEWPESLQEAINDFELRKDSYIPPVVIDLIFDRVKRIEIEEMPSELIKEKEKELIQKLKPPFNSQTACDEYYNLQGLK